MLPCTYGQVPGGGTRLYVPTLYGQSIKNQADALTYSLEYGALLCMCKALLLKYINNIIKLSEI